MLTALAAAARPDREDDISRRLAAEVVTAGGKVHLPLRVVGPGRALERSGAISGYRARLDAHALGLTFEALVFVTMRAADASPETLR
ncbi:MAG TPA: hypothetical protein VFI46_03930 [Jiangellaceae bacterium]|nr:hypothetical protein [Jiangellaceae bacterium]